MTRLPLNYKEPEIPDRDPISILDERDPFSIVNVLPTALREAVKRASVNKAYLFSMNEEEFISSCKTEGIFFNSTDIMLRDQFWIEYHYVRMHAGKKMIAGRVLADACSADVFYNHYLKNDYKVAWLCVIPLFYKRILTRHLSQLAHNMATVIDQPLINPKTGEFDKGLAAMQISLFKMIEVTLHGTPTQRIEQKTMSMNVTRHEAIAPHGGHAEDAGDNMLRRIKELEARERLASHVPKLSEWQKTPVTNAGMNTKVDDET